MALTKYLFFHNTESAPGAVLSSLSAVKISDSTGIKQVFYNPNKFFSTLPGQSLAPGIITEYTALTSTTYRKIGFVLEILPTAQDDISVTFNKTSGTFGISTYVTMLDEFRAFIGIASLTNDATGSVLQFLSNSSGPSAIATDVPFGDDFDITMDYEKFFEDEDMIFNETVDVNILSNDLYESEIERALDRAGWHVDGRVLYEGKPFGNRMVRVFEGAGYSIKNDDRVNDFFVIADGNGMFSVKVLRPGFYTAISLADDSATSGGTIATNIQAVWKD